MKFERNNVIDVKSDKARELKRDMFALLRDCLDVHMYETSNTVEVSLVWKMDGKQHQICHYEMNKRS